MSRAVISKRDKKTMECAYCGDELEGEEIKNPYKNASGELICDRCYHDEYEFTCYLCGEYAHVDDQHKMLVLAEDCGGLPRGTYRITAFPYYTSNYFDMWWNKENLERIGGVPDEIDPEEKNHPSGHLCPECQLKVMPPRLFGNPEVFEAR